jgi:hypothetical protein
MYYFFFGQVWCLVDLFIRCVIVVLLHVSPSSSSSSSWLSSPLLLNHSKFPCSLQQVASTTLVHASLSLKYSTAPYTYSNIVSCWWQILSYCCGPTNARLFSVLLCYAACFMRIAVPSSPSFSSMSVQFHTARSPSVRTRLLNTKRNYDFQKSRKPLSNRWYTLQEKQQNKRCGIQIRLLYAWLFDCCMLLFLFMSLGILHLYCCFLPLFSLLFLCFLFLFLLLLSITALLYVLPFSFFVSFSFSSSSSSSSSSFRVALDGGSFAVTGFLVCSLFSFSFSFLLFLFF